MFIYNLIRSGIDTVDIILLLLSFAIAGTFAVVLHEVSHGYAAKRNGDLTAQINNRLTFNPVAHFSPLGFLMLLLIGFGWAKPVPINPNNFSNYKKGMIEVSLAGVISNIIVALISLLFLFFTYLAFFTVYVSNSYASGMFIKFFIYLFRISLQINIILAVFNILPIYPLDGYNFLSTILPYDVGAKYKLFMVKYGTYILIGFIIFSNIMRALDIWYLDLFGMVGMLIDKLDFAVMKGAAHVIA